MKKILSLSLAALTVLTSLAGCAQTETAAPESAPTAAVNAPGAAAADSGTAAALSAYEVPGRFSGSWTGLDGALTVTADADILLPETENIMTAKVSPRSFTQEEADAMMKVFLQGSTLYEEPGPTKSDFEEQLLRYEAIQRGEQPYTGDGSIERVPEIIENLKKELEAAPNEGERFPAETTFRKREYREGVSGGDESEQLISGYAEVDGKNIHCYFSKSDKPSILSDFARFWEEGYGDQNGPNCSRGPLLLFELRDEPPIEPDISEEAAAALGGELMAELGLESFTLDSATPIAFGGNLPKFWYSYSKAVRDPVGETGWDLLYVRKLGDLSLGRTTGDGGSSEENTPYIGSWADERIRIQVTGDRVVWFEWADPYTEPEITAEKLNLLPFSDIEDIFAKIIFVKNSELTEINRVNGFDTIHDFAVDKVELSLMRTRPKDSLSEGSIIPVWDFWALTTAYTEDEEYKGLVYPGRYYEVVLTVNALDGTILDRKLGY